MGKNFSKKICREWDSACAVLKQAFKEGKITDKLFVPLEASEEIKYQLKMDYHTKLSR
jgi:hypothetical protein